MIRHVARGKTMNSPFKNFGFAGSTASEGIRLTVANQAPDSAWPSRRRGEGSTVIEFPKRPDLTVLSETIPLFYIARNAYGFWVARQADGACGGEFVLRRSAVRFARRKSAASGCGMMFLNETLELDVANEGSRLVAPIVAGIDFVTRRLPLLASFIGLAIAEWRKLAGQISRAVAGERRNREAIERELFHGEYTLSSKSDDDLPIP